MERQDLAAQWVDLHAEFAVSHNRRRRRPVLRRLAERQEVRRAEEVVHRRADLARLLERHGAGASPDRWDALSIAPHDGNPALSLEETIRMARLDADTNVSDVLEILLKRAPHARAMAELAEREPAEEIEENLAIVVAGLSPRDRLRRRLMLHLPATRRPIPESPDALCSTETPVRLQVSRQGGPDRSSCYSREPHLFLHDIVVERRLRGSGLGTAALAELCRYGDHLGLPIEGDLVPSPRRDPTALASLARWYHAAGFRFGDDEPDDWPEGARIRREPRTK